MAYTGALLVAITRWLVATAEGGDKKGAFTDDACASTKSRCAVSKTAQQFIILL